MGVKIRKAKKEDIPAISDIALGILDCHCQYSRYYEPIKDSKKRERLQLRYLREEAKKRSSRFIVADADGKIVGYAIGKIIKNPPVLRFKKTGEIAEIFIVERYRHKGIGTRMMQDLFGWFRKSKVQHSVVLFDCRNGMAREAYDKVGFRPFQEKYERYLK